MFKGLMQSFLPWILFFALTGNTNQQLDIAIITAAVTTLIFEFKGLKKRFILSWGTMVFFLFMIVFVVLFNNQWIAKYSWIFSNGALAAIAWTSVLIRRPFTIQYAKEQVSSDKWQHPLFYKINYVLTIAWGLIFLFNIELHMMKFYFPTLSGYIYEFITYLPSVLGVWFTTWFPNWYKARYIQLNQDLLAN